MTRDRELRGHQIKAPGDTCLSPYSKSWVDCHLSEDGAQVSGRPLSSALLSNRIPAHYKTITYKQKNTAAINSDHLFSSTATGAAVFSADNRQHGRPSNRGAAVPEVRGGVAVVTAAAAAVAKRRQHQQQRGRSTTQHLQLPFTTPPQRACDHCTQLTA